MRQTERNSLRAGVLSEVRVTGVLLTYRPLAEREAAALVGARLAACFGRGSVVFVPHLRPERFADFRTVVALLGRNDNPSELGRWLSELRAAVQGGVPVVLVLLDGAARPSAQHWPDDRNASVIPMSTADLDRDVERVIAILAPFVGAEEPPVSARPGGRADTTAAPDLFDGTAGRTDRSDQGRVGDLDVAAVDRGFDDADLRVSCAEPVRATFRAIGRPRAPGPGRRRGRRAAAPVANPRRGVPNRAVASETRDAGLRSDRRTSATCERFRFAPARPSPGRRADAGVRAVARVHSSVRPRLPASASSRLGNFDLATPSAV